MHPARARGGLLVGSAIAATARVASGDVLAAAGQIVAAGAREPGKRASLVAVRLPLIDAPAWSIIEE